MRAAEGNLWVAYFLLLLMLVTIGIVCSKRHRPPTTQPMPTLDEARKAFPSPPKTTTQPDSTVGYVLADLYLIGARDAPIGGQGNMIIVALYRGPQGTLAQDVTDPTDHKPFDLLMGDANMDDKVDLLDLGILSGNYGKQIDLADPTLHPWSSGDFNFDGWVDLQDLAALAGNYK